MNLSADLLAAAEAVLNADRAAGLRIATAESCTGGLVAAALTEIAGSSDVVEAGFVTYSNDAKTAMLGVSAALIEKHGAVSEQVARAMAEGALAHSRADVSIAITGVAGPSGGTAAKPVGTVWFARAMRGGETIALLHQFGDPGRAEIRRQAVLVALELLLPNWTAL